MEKIGILGGTFDPVHYGHIKLMQAVKEKLELSKIIVVPNGNPPHKEDDISPNDKISMVNEVLSDYSDFIVCDYEISKETPSYTWETVQYLKGEYPEDELYFIMGMDNLTEFKFWVKPEEICRFCKLVFVGRDKLELLEDEVSHLKATLNAEIYSVDFDFPCSSTEIKEIMKNGGYVFDKLPLEAVRYILKNGLYSEENVSEYDFYEYELAKYVEKKRFMHSLGVACTAYFLAKKHGENAKLAYFTGLVHDIAKRLPLSEQLSLCNDIKLVSDERSYPKMLHAPAGAAFLKSKYKIDNEKLLCAVRFHTIGSTKMSLFDKIIYMADYIEPFRSFDGVEDLRSLAFSDIDRAVIKGIDTTVISLISDELKISPYMLEVRNGLLEQVEKFEKA